MDFVQKFIVHHASDASPILPAHVAFVTQDGEPYGLQEPLGADATLADVIKAVNSLFVAPCEKKKAVTVVEELAVNEDSAEVDEEAEDGQKPTMDWKKADMAAYAEAHGISVEPDDTKADILDKLGA